MICHQTIQVLFEPPGPYFNGFAHFDLNFSPNFTEYAEENGQPTQGINFQVNIRSSFDTLTLAAGIGNAPGFVCHYVSICPTSGSLYVYDPSAGPSAPDVLTISTNIIASTDQTLALARINWRCGKGSKLPLAVKASFSPAPAGIALISREGDTTSSPTSLRSRSE